MTIVLSANIGLRNKRTSCLRQMVRESCYHFTQFKGIVGKEYNGSGVKFVVRSSSTRFANCGYDSDPVLVLGSSQIHPKLTIKWSAGAIITVVLVIMRLRSPKTAMWFLVRNFLYSQRSEAPTLSRPAYPRKEEVAPHIWSSPYERASPRAEQCLYVDDEAHLKCLPCRPKGDRQASSLLHRSSDLCPL